MRSLEILALFCPLRPRRYRTLRKQRSLTSFSYLPLYLLITILIATQLQAQPNETGFEITGLVGAYPADYFPTSIRPAAKALSQGDASKALKIIESQKKARRQERLDRVLYLESLAQLQKGDKRQAMQLLEQSLALRSSNSDFLFVQAQLLTNPERRLDALTQSIWFNRFVAVEPKLAQLQRAKTMVEMGQSSQASSILAGLISTDPSFIDASLALADLHLKAGRKGEALSVLRGAYAIDKSNHRLQLMLANALLTGANRSTDSNMIQEALILAESATRSVSDKDPSTYSVYAKALIESGLSEKAAEVLKSALNQNPNEVELLRLKKQLELEKGSSTEKYSTEKSGTERSSAEGS